MKKFLLKKAPSSVVRSVLMLLAASVSLTPVAKANSFAFSFSGGGLSGSGEVQVSTVAVQGVPDAYQITGISGVFSDANTGFTGAITGLEPSGLPSVNPDGTTFFPPQIGSGFSYDNLYYPAGDSPAICPPDPTGVEPPYPFFGGVLDIYGVLFDVQGGYVVDLWSNGVLPGTSAPDYGVADLHGTNPPTYVAGGVEFSSSPVPEPGSLLLVGTGMLGIVGTLRRKIKRSLQLGR